MNRNHTDAPWVDDPALRLYLRGDGPAPTLPKEVTVDALTSPPALVDPKRWAWNLLERARAAGTATREMEDVAADVIGREEFERMSGRGPFKDEQ